MAVASDLKDNLLFANLSREEIETVLPVLAEKKMDAGGTVFVENMPGESLYLIRQGTIKISKMVGEGEEKILVILGADDMFGDLAVFDGSTRSTTARVAEDAVLLKLSKDNFDQLCRKNPNLGLKIAKNIIREFSRRQRENEQEIRDVLSRLLKAAE